MGAVARGEAVRRRQAGVLVVGAAEPEIQSWLRAAGHAPAGGSACRGGRRRARGGAGRPRDRRPRLVRPRRSRRVPAPARGPAARGRVDAGDHGRRQGPDGRLGARRRRRRLPPPPVHPRRADRARPRRPARGAGARQRPAAAHADGERAGRDLPLRLARGLHAGDDHRRDRADLGLSAGQLPGLHAAHDPQHRPSRGRRHGAGGDRAGLGRERRAVPARVPDRARRRRRALGARPRPARARRRRAAVDGRRDVRHHRAPRRPRRRCCATRSRRPGPPSCARRAPASSRPPTTPGARSSATSTTAPSSGSCRSCSTSRSRAGG